MTIATTDRMADFTYAVGEPPSFAAKWTSRLALFAAVILPVTAFLHRVFSMPTPTAYYLVITALGIACLALLLAVVAAADIWQSGRSGAARVIFGGALSLIIFALPAAVWKIASEMPGIIDVSTDVSNPPAFNAIAAKRTNAFNSPAYSGGPRAALQAVVYPDLKTVDVTRPSDETFDLAVEAIKRLKMTILRETPPDPKSATPGIIEAEDYTIILGLQDDVVIRVAGDAGAARIDVRSQARYGSIDFGRNAERVRTILKEIDSRLVANPVAAPKLPVASEKPVLKQAKSRSRTSKARRSPRDRVPSGIPRGLGQIE